VLVLLTAVTAGGRTLVATKSAQVFPLCVYIMEYILCLMGGVIICIVMFSDQILFVFKIHPQPLVLRGGGAVRMPPVQVLLA
jgi:hypothetical protein